MSDEDGNRPKRRRRLRPLVLAQAAAVASVASLFSILVWTVASGSPGAGLVSAIARGERPPAPSFDLPLIWSRPATWPLPARPALADGRVALEELRGTPVVLNFWASWCIPCKDEAPVLAAAARAHRRDVAFLGIDIQDFSSDARGFLRRFDVPYPSVRERGDSTYRAYGITGVPETYYVDARGRILEHATGAVSREELERAIAMLVRDDLP